MRVKWMEMTSPEVLEMSRKTRVALLPVGSIESHGPHLPCGIDGFSSEKLCEMAAQIEPAILLPTLFFNICAQGMYWPGCIATRPETTLRIYEDVCAESARNGFDRILFCSGHGSSEIVIQYYQEDLNRGRLQKDPGYVVFWVSEGAPMRQVAAEVIETKGGHACEMETSVAMFVRPDLVRKDLIPGQAPMNEVEPTGAYSGLDWALRVREGYVGQPAKATFEKGEKLFHAGAENLAEIIRRVKTFDPQVCR